MRGPTDSPATPSTRSGATGPATSPWAEMARTGADVARLHGETERPQDRVSETAARTVGLAQNLALGGCAGSGTSSAGWALVPAVQS
jgi:hypothetical protein